MCVSVSLIPFNERVICLIVYSRSVRLSTKQLLLHSYHWNIDHIVTQWKRNAQQLLVDARIKPSCIVSHTRGTSDVNLTTAAIGGGGGGCSGVSTNVPIINRNCSIQQQQQQTPQVTSSTITTFCGICLEITKDLEQDALSCGHKFCRSCWTSHLDIQVHQGCTVTIECMAQGCRILVPEDFALPRLSCASSREKYEQFAFYEYIKSHPFLRFCPGVNCNSVIKAQDILPLKVTCAHCSVAFCFKCASGYHAPTDCETIKRWLTKCADDSETANYISANTKDCPKCHICIEKNGGCNHMQCFSCKYEFCWMCLGDWKSHGSEYYECSRYKENPEVTSESAHVQAREALKKYLFYYERWENHARSLRLEEHTLAKIKERIQLNVMANKGTWIDWQYLLDAAALLAKCRYTLQYTYPYAYYLDAGPRKDLFEYQQAQLEAEIENLSWKIERADTTDPGDLQNQMDIAEKRRATLLKDFLQLE